MGAIDTFLQAHASPGLEPGETIQGMGHIRQPYRLNALLGTPEAQTEHLAVATDRRLIIFTTELGGTLTPVLKPVAHPPVTEWRYHDLARVVNVTPMRPVVHSGGAVVEMTLVPHMYCGPFAHEGEVGAKRYDVYRAADGLDAQGAFFAQFPKWLEGAVAAQRFPMPPARRAELDAKHAAAAQQRAADAARRAANAAELDRKIEAAGATAKRVGPLVGVGVVALLVVMAAGVWAIMSFERAADRADSVDVGDKTIKEVKEDIAWVRAGGVPPARCDEDLSTRLSYAHFSSRELQRCGCELVWSEQRGTRPPRAGWKVHPRTRGWELECPPAATYESELKLRKSARDDAQSEQLSSTIQGIVSVVVALLVAVGGLLLVLKMKRARAPAPA